MTERAMTKAPIVPAYIQAATDAWGQQRMRLLRDTIARDLTIPELGLFVEVCRRTGLDPFARQIYAVKRYDKRLGREIMTIQTGIDGFRTIAERTGRYEGQDGPYWCGPDGVWRDVWLDEEPPVAAKVGVYRAGWRATLWGTALWREYAQTSYKDNQPIALWRSHPSVMIAKCAEAIALRRTFPQELSGVYTTDEIDTMTTAELKTASDTTAATIVDDAPSGPVVVRGGDADDGDVVEDAEVISIDATETDPPGDDPQAVTAVAPDDEPPKKTTRKTAAKKTPTKKREASGASAAKTLRAFVDAVRSCESTGDVDDCRAAWDAKLQALPRGEDMARALLRVRFAELADGDTAGSVDAADITLAQNLLDAFASR